MSVAAAPAFPLEGGCTCRAVRYRVDPGGGDAIAFVRVGTLDAPDVAPPELHIYVASKQPWLPLPADARAFEAFYDPRVEWPAESLQRYRVARQRD